MKKILIIADGILAKQFLERVVNIQSDSNEYVVVAYRKSITLPSFLPKNFKLHSFDPTSLEKISSVLDESFDKVIIVTSKKVDLIGAYKNIRNFDKKVAICVIDRWDLNIRDKNTTSINSKEVLSSLILDELPNIPVFAHNIGLGLGEIMEVRVPAGSSYAYRHLGNIEQKKWRISCIFRHNTIVLPKPTLMIQPNDLLLTVGEPATLQNVYKSIKEEVGQFPLPFGSNIYLFIDMLRMDNERIENLLNDTLFLHEKLKSKKLYIRVINSNNSEMFKRIKSLENGNVEVDVNYYDISIEKNFDIDLKNFNVGMCVVDKLFFEKNIHMLYRLKVPIFKTGVFGVQGVERSIVFGVSLRDAEEDSSVLFDLSNQLNLQTELYIFSPDYDEDEQHIIAEHFENTAKLYGRNIKIIQKSDKNPILELKNQSNFLQFVPFYGESLKSKIISFFSNNINNLHFVLNDKYQIFLPTV
ncbi:MAG: potassium transporter TrkA [Campylobacteraceae bacterium]|jgi:hypothetical protein|nr:potassium transporter TrkA [Campylobacteraceae bacterium]